MYIVRIHSELRLKYSRSLKQTFVQCESFVEGTLVTNVVIVNRSVKTAQHCSEQLLSATPSTNATRDEQQRNTPPEPFRGRKKPHVNEAQENACKRPKQLQQGCTTFCYCRPHYIYLFEVRPPMSSSYIH